MTAASHRRYGTALAYRLEPDEKLLAVSEAKRPHGPTPDHSVVLPSPDTHPGMKSAALYAGQLAASGIEFIDDLGHGGPTDWLVRLLFGRMASGGPTTIAAGWLAAVPAGVTSLFAVTDRRLIICRIGRSTGARRAPLAAAKLTPLWSVRTTDVTGARRRWHRLHGARVRVNFRDGSWIELTGPLCLGRRRAGELCRALGR